MAAEEPQSSQGNKLFGEEYLPAPRESPQHSTVLVTEAHYEPSDMHIQ